MSPVHRVSATAALLVAVLIAPPPPAGAAVIQRVFGANQSEIGWASPGGGVHVYLAGTGIGSAFAPPEVFLGINADAVCHVQPFTSTRNRLHCIVSPEGLPPPDPQYDPAGRFVSHPLRILKGGKLAMCWHTGGINHACFLRFDLAGNPRLHQLLTPVVQSAGLLRMRGRGIDGGQIGAPGMIATLYRGNGQLVVGACGEKDCAPSNFGMETIGCFSRVDGSGDAVRDQNHVPATAFSNETHFGCKLDALAGGTNDLEAPAIRIQPVIADVLAALRAADGVRFARMSGSGATCFAIFRSHAEAVRAADAVSGQHPDWWVEASILS